MNEIVFFRRKLPHKTHTLTAALSMEGHLIFDDGEYYPATENDDGREVDDYLRVLAQHKYRVLFSLEKQFVGISATCGENEVERLMCTLERVAKSGHWKNLHEIED